MIAVNEYDDIVAMYVKKFGTPPVVTGGSVWQSNTIIERLLDAIDSGEPFVDTPVPDDVLT